jgi:hypothetical protein
MASKSMNTLYLEQLAFLRQKRMEERAHLVRTGRKTILSLLLVLAVVALFIQFLFPAILGHPAPPLVLREAIGERSAQLHQVFAETSALAQDADIQGLSLKTVHSWYRHQTQGVEQLAQAVPQMVISLYTH